MANKLYETLFLIDPTKVSADAESVKQQLHTLIERHGGHIEVSRPWDYNHKLSYPIGKQKKGSYHIIYYTFESTKQAELERDLPEDLQRHDHRAEVQPRVAQARQHHRVARAPDRDSGGARQGCGDVHAVGLAQ